MWTRSLLVLLFAALVLSCSNGEHKAHDEGRRTSVGVSGSERACASETPPSAEIQITGPDEPGRRLTVTGAVIDRRTQTPIPGVTIYAYHTDSAGHYSETGPTHPRLCGILRTGDDGRYRIETIIPGSYPGGGNPA